MAKVKVGPRHRYDLASKKLSKFRSGPVEKTSKVKKAIEPFPQLSFLDDDDWEVRREPGPASEMKPVKSGTIKAALIKAGTRAKGLKTIEELATELGYPDGHNITTTAWCLLRDNGIGYGIVKVDRGSIRKGSFLVLLPAGVSRAEAIL